MAGCPSAVAIMVDITCRELQMMRDNDLDFNLTLDNYSYFDKNNISEMISRFMGEVSFTGVSVNFT